jgi:outer membrane lipoprotein-sorting protein
VGFFPATRFGVLVLVFASLFSSACLVRHRLVAPPGKTEHRPLLTADKAELIRRLHAISDPIQTFTMKVDMAPSVGNLRGGTVSDYPTISGYVLFRQPDQMRVIGLDPVIHGTAFDMLSTGKNFVVSIPSRNEFIEGSNDAPANSPNKLENLRPEAFFGALMIRPPADLNLTVLEDDTDESRANYVLLMLKREGEELKLERSVYFDRYSLDITRQVTFDAVGNIKGDTKYQNWKPYGNIQFPSIIDMERPIDGYELVLTVTDLKVNAPEVTADRFVLNQPPNAKVRVLKE